MFALEELFITSIHYSLARTYDPTYAESSQEMQPYVHQHSSQTTDIMCLRSVTLMPTFVGFNLSFIAFIYFSF